MARWLLNPFARREGFTIFTSRDLAAAATFFDGRPDLAPSPLHHLRGLAHDLGLGDVLVKDESSRFGLNAFKIVGVTYALERLAATGRIAAGAVVACATAGNHGRAVARAARARGIAARVYVPAATIPARIDAIRAEGAHVIISPGSYDDTVRMAARDAEREGWIVVSDTSWEGYDEIPRAIMVGYTWILEEASRQWLPEAAPDVVIVQAGVGGLAAAAASWLSVRYGADRPRLIVCEPANAACLMASAAAGCPTRVEGPLETVMAGLRCGEMSPAAWPAVREGVDAFLAIEDDEALAALRTLSRPASGDARIVTAPSGACALAALIALRRDPDLATAAAALGLRDAARALVLVTEGDTEKNQ